MNDPLPLGAGAVPLQRGLLLLGALAGPFYIAVGLTQALTREGFDMRRHALSLLSNGDLGWIQIANFLIAGTLVMAGAVGLRRWIQGSPAGTWGPVLLGGYGVGLLGAGVFIADPGLGFPPGTPVESTGMSRTGLLHFVFGGIGFYALIGACFVFAHRFKRLGEPAWAAYSIVTGIGFLMSFGAIASGSTAPATMLTFYAAVAWVWIWHTALYVKLTRDAPFTPNRMVQS
jgi:hypothetical protein